MPQAMTVTAKVPAKDGKPEIGPYSITVQSGATAAEMIEMFGDSAVKSNADSNWAVTIQSNMRSAMKRGETQEQMQARLGNAKMGEAQRGAKVDTVQAFLAQFASAKPEEQAKLMAEITARAAKEVGGSSKSIRK